MTHRIPVNKHYTEGESIKWEFTVEDEEGATINLSNVSIEWYLVEREGSANTDAILDHNDSGVDIDIVDAQNGRFDLQIDPDVTMGEGGENHWHRIIAKDGTSAKQIWSGEFPINSF